MGEEGKRHYVLNKYFNVFMYDHTLWKETFLLLFFLQAFSTEEISIRHFKDCFKINGKTRMQMPSNGEYLKFKNVHHL